MSPEERERIECDIREQCRRADFAAAATAAIRGYGPELYGFLLAFHRDEQDANEVHSIVVEQLWRGLPKFNWGCSFRTWAYKIAHNTSKSYRAGVHRHDREHAPLSGTSQLSELAEKVRSETATYLRTETKSRVAALRASLTVEEQALLSLRVDRGLAWDDLVLVLHASDDPLTAEALRRESAKMRQRFQAVKTKLRELARRDGLLDDDS